MMRHLTPATEDAIYPADFLTYFTGLSPGAPLSSPTVRLQPLRVGLSQQTLWGAINSYPNSFSVRYCSYL